MKRWQIVGVFVLVGGLVWLIKSVTTPPPGKQIPALGRDHVTGEMVGKTQYNSNPPTSGPHLSTWVKPGIYTTPQSDGELVHSLEHGYVIISYNCSLHLKAGKINLNAYIAQSVSAHEEGLNNSGQGSPSASFTEQSAATGSAVNESQPCRDLVKNLEDLARKKKLFKLIVVPRPQLDTTIALTAWTYIDKFDPPAGGFDATRIERFIDFHRDHGPEQTME